MTELAEIDVKRLILDFMKEQEPNIINKAIVEELLKPKP